MNGGMSPRVMRKPLTQPAQRAGGEAGDNAERPGQAEVDGRSAPTTPESAEHRAEREVDAGRRR